MVRTEDIGNTFSLKWLSKGSTLQESSSKYPRSNCIKEISHIPYSVSIISTFCISKTVFKLIFLLFSTYPSTIYDRNCFIMEWIIYALYPPLNSRKKCNNLNFEKKEEGCCEEKVSTPEPKRKA